MNFHFGEFSIDGDERVLRRGEEEIALGWKATDILLLLLRKAGSLVSKDKVFESVWEGRAVSDDALYAQMLKLRKALGDQAKPHRFVQTAHGQGFRFVAEVTREGPAAAAASLADQTAPDQRVGRPPRVAVLPFQSYGPKPRFPGLLQALPDDIIYELSQLRWLDVISRQSSFLIDPSAQAQEDARTRLDADYCVAGFIEETGDTVDVSLELSDARDLSVVWRERYRASSAEFHEMRHEIVSKVASTLDHLIPQRELARTRLLNPSTLTAWENYQVAMAHIYSNDPAWLPTAEAHLTKALSIDPQFARAHAGMSQLGWWRLMVNQSQDESWKATMADHARQALSLDRNDPFANMVNARLVWFTQGSEEGRPMFERTLELSPSYSIAHGTYANYLLMNGEGALAASHAKRASELSPLDPLSSRLYTIRAIGNLVEGDTEEAVKWSRKALAEPDEVLMVLQGALMAFHAHGAKEETARVAAHIARMPGDTSLEGALATLPIRSDRFAAFLKDAYRSTGLAEHRD